VGPLGLPAFRPTQWPLLLLVNALKLRVYDKKRPFVNFFLFLFLRMSSIHSHVLSTLLLIMIIERKNKKNKIKNVMILHKSENKFKCFVFRVVY
jgi:hypothetical protein